MSTVQEQSISRNGLSAAQWAVLFAASYYIPIPREEFIELAILDADEAFEDYEIEHAISQCLAKGWIVLDTDPREEELRKSLPYFGADYPDYGIILTKSGAEIKNSVLEATLNHLEQQTASISRKSKLARKRPCGAAI